MTGQIKQRVDLGDAHVLRAIRNLYNVVASSYLAFFQNPKVKPWSVMLHQQGGHPRLVHSDSNSVARHSGLRHFEHCAANSITVTNADLIVRQAVYGEVLAELSKHEVLSP
jgi:hypothetical protein